MKPGAFQSLPREYTTHLDWATARWPKYLIISRFMIFCIEFSLASTNSYLLVLLSTNLLLRIKLDSNEQASMDVSTGQELWPLQFINFSKPHHFAGQRKQHEMLLWDTEKCVECSSFTLPCQDVLPSTLEEAWRAFSSCAIPLHVTISLCHGTALCLGDPLQLCLQGKGAFDPVAQRQICRSQSSCTSNSSPQLVYCRTGFIIKKKKKIVSEVQGVIDASWFQLLAPHSSPSPHTTALFVDDFKMLQELHFPSTTYLRAF